MKKKIIIAIVSVVVIASVITAIILPKGIYDGGASATFEIDLKNKKGVASNVVSNNNIWDMGEAFYNPTVNEENNPFEFVE